MARRHDIPGQLIQWAGISARGCVVSSVAEPKEQILRPYPQLRAAVSAALLPVLVLYEVSAVSVS